MVRTRIAPSPTGFAHIGTAYSALFNFAFARKNKGKFIVRIEDTDTKREVKGAEKAIFDGLSWLGLTWDEGPDIGGPFGPYRQSERLSIYQSKVKELEEKGLAYKDEGAVRFKNSGENVSWQDQVRGEISFPGDEVSDFVLIKSDGYPTYNFAVVIDDIEMRITHVIRGEEHISNTPRQIALYRAFGASEPFFAHLPTIRNRERKKLSKRRDPVDLRLYREDGYLPEALVNFLSLLGWSHPEGKEHFALQEFVENFSLERVRKAGPVFDTAKLDWMNGEYLRQLSDDKLMNLLIGYLGKDSDQETVRKTAPLVKTRIKKLSEYQGLVGFLFTKPKIDRSLLGKDYKDHLVIAKETIEETSPWQLEELNDNLKKAIEAKKFKVGDFFMDLRVAVAGQKVSPPINESILILGKEETVERLKSLL